MQALRTTRIYCDGASRKDGRGGWGFVVYHGSIKVRTEYGGAYDTTNNRMELQAAIESLKTISVGARVEIISDSKYVIDGILNHVDLWLRTGWRTSSNQPVKNKDLWEELVILDLDRRVRWTHVKGHSGDAGNEEADAAAARGVPDAPPERRRM